MYLRSAIKFMIVAAALIITVPLTISAQRAIPITVESGVIPPNFNKNNDTLLIYSGGMFYNNSMKKHFKKSYTGPILFTNKINKHSLETCRFVLYEKTERTMVITSGGMNNGQSRTKVEHENFYILDRYTDKKYVNPNMASPKLIKAYLEGLELARQ